jgi:gas vesicle protein
MHEFLFFLIGLMIGGIVGIVTMCLLQINRLNDNERKDGNDDEAHR